MPVRKAHTKRVRTRNHVTKTVRVRASRVRRRR